MLDIEQSSAFKAAQEILRRINVSPRTPTVDQLAQILLPYMGTNPKVDAIVNMSPEVQELREMRAMRRYRDAQISRAPKEDQERLEDEHDAELALQEPRKTMLTNAILSRPTKSWRDLVEKALVAEEYAIAEAANGTWHELLEDHPQDRSIGELVLGVLIIAGLTDGTVERHGLDA